MVECSVVGESGAERFMDIMLSCHFHRSLGGMYFFCPYFTAQEADAWRESVVIQALTGSGGGSAPQ